MQARMICRAPGPAAHMNYFPCASTSHRATRPPPGQLKVQAVVAGLARRPAPMTCTHGQSTAAAAAPLLQSHASANCHAALQQHKPAIPTAACRREGHGPRSGTAIWARKASRTAERTSHQAPRCGRCRPPGRPCSSPPPAPRTPQMSWSSPAAMVVGQAGAGSNKCCSDLLDAHPSTQPPRSGPPGSHRGGSGGTRVPRGQAAASCLGSNYARPPAGSRAAAGAGRKGGRWQAAAAPGLRAHGRQKLPGSEEPAAELRQRLQERGA